jgi:ABC-type dipeptide/oligopeptide/nickel transport systems, permease components
MLALVARRVFLSAVTLAIVCPLVFTITEILPGDVATAYLGREATPDRLATFRANAGLDRPAPIRFLAWANRLSRGDLGVSFGRRKSVRELLGIRFRNTLLLASMASLAGVPIAILLGIIAGLTRGRPSDLLISGVATGLMSIPGFVTAILLTLVFSSTLGMLPAVATASPDAPLSELLPGAILPALTLVLACSLSIPVAE